MKNISIYKYLVVSVMMTGLLSVIGCRPLDVVVDKDILNTEPKLVVNSMISPSSSKTIVEVSLSVPSIHEYNNNPSNTIVSDAEVKLIGPNGSVLLGYDSNEEYYFVEATDFPIESGLSYRLEVEGEGRSVFATCTVPQEVTPFTHELREVSKSDATHEVKMRWQGAIDTESYYYTEAFVGEPSNFTYFNNGIYLEAPYHQDAAKNGALMQWRRDFYLDIDNIKANYPDTKLNLRLFTTDHNFYNYFKTVDRYEGDDPFSEIIVTHTNITGGLGIFAAYQLNEMEAEL